ncbi:MAG: hypothetical protein LCH47_12825 [Proteobacteria bacterium]|nr:hypothetical protein [Pseudomonadota bacterium]
MGIDQIIATNDICTKDGFDKAMREAEHLSEGELRYILSYDPGAQGVDFKKKQALARAEIDRRSFLEHKKIVWVSATFGFIGVIAGALLQTVLTKVLQ